MGWIILGVLVCNFMAWLFKSKEDEKDSTPSQSPITVHTGQGSEPRQGRECRRGYSSDDHKYIELGPNHYMCQICGRTMKY